MAYVGWRKGQSGNPKGRPKNPEIEQFRQALEKVAKEKDTTLLESIIRRAYKSDSLAQAVLKKILPDLTSADIKGEGFEQIIQNFVSYANSTHEHTRNTNSSSRV